ncbi:histidinol-phosphate transaminase [Pseudoneobacillus rhizosphaerae]|uniref:Histidinol-phosphate aminotransferase n=1 Tax=Pseudoneobacillus rhizosphaerae TaxID=2880968 RepID=A0A9C7G6H8_9BACI|nr:histidinol-phosphate transaminase [Pseudoneobacillus rhizosphaerae]CAG9606442.1 Histidinol-phosphate aminotransferase [Pseudoneobacillus rhizosphaerae]
MSIKPKKQIEQLKPYPIGMTLEDIQSKYQPKKLRKMSDNENVYGFSSKVTEALRSSLHSLSLYPDATTERLCEQLSYQHKVPKNYFLIGNGSEELIRLLTRAFISDGDEAIMADITFPIYKSNVMIEGGLPVFVPIVEGTHDLQAMYEAISDRTKMIFICNPNNPTGTCVDPSELKKFIQKIPAHILVVLDEAYDEYMEQHQKIDSITLLMEHPNLVLLRTFSKIYGLAALRVGYGIMHPTVMEQLIKVKEVFNVNKLGQNAAIVALKDQPFVKDCAEKNLIERNYLSRRLSEQNLSFFPSQTNFLFIYNLGEIESLNERLLQQGIVSRFFPFPQFNGSMRLTLGTREDHETLLDVFDGLYTKEEVANNGSQSSLT